MSKFRAIVVEDDVHLGRTFQKVLEICGFDVDYIPDSEQAIDKIIEIKPDIILLDLQMPKVSGLDILKSLRADDAIAKTKVILLTANSYAIRDNDLNTLADLVLIKPASVNQISDFALRLINMNTP